MSVLLIILTFAFFIGLDFLIGLRRAHRREEIPARGTARKPALATAPFAVEPVWVGGYQLPEEYQYHRGHTWARALDSDTVLVGLDDFARKLLGPARNIQVPDRGAHLRQGSKGFEVEVDGKSAEFVSPVDGEVVEVNPDLHRNPHLATDDPYGRGWILKMKSHNLARNLRNLLSGTLARKWVEDSRERLELQLMALSGSVLQDGGMPVADLARRLSDEDWKRLVGEFLLT
jgi:glycine cleavage system H lipoate-binding protein